MPKISEPKTTRITISTHTVIRVLTLITAFSLGIQFIRGTTQIWVLLIVAFFLTLALNPPVSWLSRRIARGRRGLATALAYLVVLAALGSLIFSIAPPIVDQSRQLINELPTYVDNVETSNDTIPRWLRDHGFADDLQVTKDQVLDGLNSAGSPIFTVFKRIGGSLAATLTVLVLTFLMLVEGPDWLNKFWAFHRKDRLKHRQELAMRMYHVVTGYVNGQLLIAFIAGAVSFVMLKLLGVPYALSLAAIVGVMGLIPLIGATLGGLLLVVVGMFQSVATGITLLIFFVVYQQFENYVLHPRIQSRKVEISPLLVLVSALFGVQLAGLLGALLAIPVAASLRILFNDFAERHGLITKKDEI